MLTAWVVFPTILALLCAGCGIVLDRVAGARLPSVLLLPAGYAVIVVVAGTLVWAPGGAQLAVPAVAGLALAGGVLALGGARRNRRSTGERVRDTPSATVAAFGAAVAVFVLYAAPVVATGTPTIAGYISLDDHATWFAFTDHVLDEGRNVGGLAPSSYEATLDSNLGGGYPVGALLPFGIAARLAGVDVAWAFQPYLASLAALLALVLFALARRSFERQGAAAVAAVVAAQPALLYAFGLWGGVKELAAALLVPLWCATALPPRGPRAAIVPGVVAGALLGVLTMGGGVWLAFAGLALVVMAIERRALAYVAVLVATAAAAALPAIGTVAWFASEANRETLSSADELGNLVGPLDPLQLFGIWPTGDFRVEPDHRALAVVLIALAAALAVGGALAAVRRRDVRLAAYVATALCGWAVLALAGSPWVDAKAMATASPALLLAAAVGCSALARAAGLVAGLAAGAVVAAGVLWSNALAYGETWLAPHAQLAELEEIGERFAGSGPALMTEYQPVGVRHFLRRLDPEGSSELRRRPIPLLDGALLEKGSWADLDEHAYDAITTYRTLVLRRSPVASRPPSPYALRWQGRWYEVWERLDDASPVALHRGLGDRSNPVAPISCDAVNALAEGGSTVAAVVRPPLLLQAPVAPDASGRSVARFTTPSAMRVRIWLGGSVLTSVTASVDGRRVGSSGYHLARDGQYIDLGDISLGAGAHRLELRFDRPGLAPGSRAARQPVGPVAVEQLPVLRAVAAVPAERAQELCDRPLDWIERLG